MKRVKRHSGLAARPIANVSKRGGAVFAERGKAVTERHYAGSETKEHIFKMVFLASETFLRLMFLIIRTTIDG